MFFKSNLIQIQLFFFKYNPMQIQLFFESKPKSHVFSNPIQIRHFFRILSNPDPTFFFRKHVQKSTITSENGFRFLFVRFSADEVSRMKEFDLTNDKATCRTARDYFDANRLPGEPKWRVRKVGDHHRYCQLFVCCPPTPIFFFFHYSFLIFIF